MWLPILGILAVLFMVNASKAVAFISGKAFEIELASVGDGHSLRVDAAAAFNRMRAAALEAGWTLKVNSGFRTNLEQDELYALYKAGKGNLAALPGYSNHQNGIAVDIQVGGFESGVYQWLAFHAKTYGFVNTGKNFSQKEPWHWEYKP